MNKIIGNLSGFFFLNGFMGILSFAVLGMSRSIPISLVSHCCLVGLCYWWFSSNGDKFILFRNAKRQRMKIVFFGIIFVLAGFWAAHFAPEGDGEDSMTKGDRIYFGVIFELLGLGIVTSQLSLNKGKRK